MDSTSKQGTFAVRSRTRHLGHSSRMRARWFFWRLKHRRSDEKKKAINLAVNAFQQFAFTDPNTGTMLKYNLYVPKDYDANRSYPLVLFIHDRGVVSSDTRRTLVQGHGAVVWATPSEQAKHESFVLAPQYAHGIVNDRFEATQEVDVTVDLVRALEGQYSIDGNRLYTTGQSMGCMASIEMLDRKSVV